MFNWLKKLKSETSNVDVKVSQQSSVPRQPIKRSNPHRILICDDAAFMRMMLKNVLTQDGYEVVAEAQDGLEAIERYSEFKPDLVFMDTTMPTMDGIEATRKIMKRDSHANIVICSAMGQEKLVMEAIRLGAKDFIVKPFHPEAILKAVVKIFEPWRIATPPVETEQSQTVNTTPTVQTQSTQNKTVSNTSTVNTPIRQTLNKQRFNFQGYETSYPNLADIRGKVLEVILLSGSDDNGFFNYYANVAKNILPSWGRNIIPQNDRQKSIVVKDNEYWICQYFYNPYDTSVDGIVEYTLHLDSNGKISVAWDDTDDMIPDTDIYRTGMTPLWTVLGDFISLPTTYDQRKEIATWVEKSSQGTFIYEEQYHDIRSYSLGRSATLEETAMLLSIEDVWAKVEFVKK